MRPTGPGSGDPGGWLSPLGRWVAGSPAVLREWFWKFMHVGSESTARDWFAFVWNSGV